MKKISIKPEEGKCPYLDDSDGYLPLLFPFQDAYTYRATPPLIFAFPEPITQEPWNTFSLSIDHSNKNITIALTNKNDNDRSKWEKIGPYQCKCLDTEINEINAYAYVSNEKLCFGRWHIKFFSIEDETEVDVCTFCLMPFLYPRPGEQIASKKPLFFVDKNIAKDCSKYKLHDANNNSYNLIVKDSVGGSEASVWTSEKDPEKGVYTVYYNNNPLELSSCPDDDYKIEITECMDIDENHLQHLLRQFFRDWSIWNVAESYTHALFQDLNYRKDPELPLNSPFEDRQYDNRYESEREVTWQNVLTAGGRGIFTGDRVVNNQQTDNLPYPDGMIPICSDVKFYSDPAELAILYMASKWIGRQSLNSFKAHMLIGHFHRPLLFPIRKEQVKQAFKYVSFNPDEDAFVKSHISILSIIENCLSSSKECDIKTAFSRLNETRRLPWDWISDFYSFIYDYSKGSEFFSRLKVNPQLLFYGPPGTGKTFMARIESEWMIDWWWYNKIAKQCCVDRKIKSRYFIELCQFHPSYTYEEFIEGMRPDVRNGLTYR
jgi:hypothetical protein